jgi:hypothetical protein
LQIPRPTKGRNEERKFADVVGGTKNTTTNRHWQQQRIPFFILRCFFVAVLTFFPSHGGPVFKKKKNQRWARDTH